jgi:hypothetical protein
VDVKGAVVELVRVDAELVGVRTDIRQRDAGRLLHDVPELAGENQAFVGSLHGGRLDEENVAAGAGDGKARSDPRNGCSLSGLLEELLSAERVAHDLHVDGNGHLDLLRDDARRGLSEDRPELSLELTNARLARVFGDYGLDDGIVDVYLVGQETVPLDLPRPEIAASDSDLLVDRVAVEANDLHAVEERARDRVGHVGSRNEEDLRKVQLDVEVVVAERVVLRRVEHLEERGRRVSTPVGADLIDLVQHDHGVHRLRVPEGADQSPRERTDVRAAVPADLCLVAHSAQ